MRIALLSDIHGNVVALEAVLAHLRRATAPDAVVIAGDLVADGPRPAEALALLRSLPDAQFVIGNTDEDVLHERDDAEKQWTRDRLSPDDVRWLDGLPFQLSFEATPGHALLVVHANPRNLHDQIKPDTSPVIIRPLLNGVREEIVAFGHYHVPHIREVDGITLVDVASVGLPRDGLLRAVYAVIDWDGAAWQIAHHRIAFDAHAVANDYHQVGYPDAEKAAKKLLKARY
jgi:putative phosphoesterase